MAHRGSLLVGAADGGRVGGDYGSAVARRGSAVHPREGLGAAGHCASEDAPSVGRRRRGPLPGFRDPRDTRRRGAGTRR